MCKLKVSKKYVLGPLSVTVKNISYEKHETSFNTYISTKGIRVIT